MRGGNPVVPVAGIARRVGVSESTIYKYVRKGQWRLRHGSKGIAEPVAKRARQRTPWPCVTAKGAGGRFICAKDADKAFARGLKALDPQGQGRALQAYERAVEADRRINAIAARFMLQRD
jgi:AcrR family transcriptional regulator